jgi:hypothetical protein
VSADTRADDMPRVRDEVAAQLHRLADLVQNDRWEEAERLAPVVTSAYSTCCNRWRSLKQRRAAERDIKAYDPQRAACMGLTRACEEQLEACRQDAIAYSARRFGATQRMREMVKSGRVLIVGTPRTPPHWVEAVYGEDAGVSMGYVEYPSDVAEDDSR